MRNCIKDLSPCDLQIGVINAYFPNIGYSTSVFTKPYFVLNGKHHLNYSVVNIIISS